MFRIFPLYQNDDIVSIDLKHTNIENIIRLKDAISNKDLKLVENHCLCDRNRQETDVVISEKDRYGLPIPQILCSKCGLIRSKFVFDKESNNVFYAKYYRGIYAQNSETPMESLWADQYCRGKSVLRLIESVVELSEINHVVEIGTGMGGILMPFKEMGKFVKGYDFDKDYIEYGKEKGLDLYCGDFYDYTIGQSFDLLILSHVFEHFLNPLYELRRILDKIKVGKYVYIEVPGIFNIDKAYNTPILYFQNAHTYNYFKDYLVEIFESFGLRVVYGDEICRFVVQRISGQIPDVHEINSDKLTIYPSMIKKYLFIIKHKKIHNFVLLFRRILNKCNFCGSNTRLY